MKSSYNHVLNDATAGKQSDDDRARMV